MRKSRNNLRSLGPSLFDACQDIMNECYEGPDQAQACAYWTKCAVGVLNEMGHDAIPQAGTAFWPRIPNPQRSDHGLFGYKWEGIRSPRTQEFLSQGHLPEMHCWVGLIEENAIIDLTTGFQSSQCQRIIGKNWHKSVALPHVLIRSLLEINNSHMIYQANQDACELLVKVWQDCPWGASVAEPEIIIFTGE
jgi:hypothetical protein